MNPDFLERENSESQSKNEIKFVTPKMVGEIFIMGLDLKAYFRKLVKETPVSYDILFVAWDSYRFDTTLAEDITEFVSRCANAGLLSKVED